MARTRIGCYLVSVNDGMLLVTHIAPGFPAAGRWTLPGGGIHWGEDPGEALEREVFEETGFSLDSYRYLGADSRSFPEREGIEALHWIRLFYGADLSGEPRITEVGGSVDDVRWVPMSDVRAMPTVDTIESGLEFDRSAP